MPRLRALILVVLAAGCGLDIVGAGAVGQPDVTPPSGAEASTSDGASPDVAPSDGDVGAAVDAAPLDAALDAPSASDASGCASCPAGTAQMLCVANACQSVRRVFVTHGGFNGNLGGQAGADAKCTAAAKAAHLNGTWLSWTTVAGNNAPQDRFSKPDVPYRLLDGTQIAPNGAQLLPATGAVKLDHTIDVDENGKSMDQDPESEVWTGTTIYGFGSGSNCLDWTSNKNTDEATVGHLNEVGQNFTDVYLQTCDRNAQHLYCFEQ